MNELLRDEYLSLLESRFESLSAQCAALMEQIRSEME